jgi:hypothetical protein
MAKQRKINVRKVNKRVLILCEGYTEYIYFEALKSDRKNKLYSVEIDLIDSKKNTNKELVEEAKEFKKKADREKNPYQKICVVVDKDGYTKHPEAFDTAHANKIDICFSNVCFEIWFLFHFTKSTKQYLKCEEVIKDLKKYIPNYDKSENSYDHLLGSRCEAIENAESVRNSHSTDIDRGVKVYNLNPYTDMDKLIKYLLNIDWK